MAALTDDRLTAIDRYARERRTAMDRVTLELVAEIRRLRTLVGDTPADEG